MTTPVKVPRLPIPNGYQLTISVSQNGQLSNVVLGAISGTVPLQADVELFYNRMWDALRAGVSDTCSATGATFRDVSATEDVLRVLGAPDRPLGTAAGAPSLAAGATLVKWRTTNGSRSGKGRTFIPGLPGGATQAGGRALTAAHQTAVTAALDLNVASLQSNANLKLAVLSFRRGVAYVVNGWGVAPIPGVQRKRMR